MNRGSAEVTSSKLAGRSRVGSLETEGGGRPDGIAARRRGRKRIDQPVDDNNHLARRWRIERALAAVAAEAGVRREMMLRWLASCNSAVLRRNGRVTEGGWLVYDVVGEREWDK